MISIHLVGICPGGRFPLTFPIIMVLPIPSWLRIVWPKNFNTLFTTIADNLTGTPQFLAIHLYVLPSTEFEGVFPNTTFWRYQFFLCPSHLVSYGLEITKLTPYVITADVCLLCVYFLCIQWILYIWSAFFLLLPMLRIHP